MYVSTDCDFFKKDNRMKEQNKKPTTAFADFFKQGMSSVNRVTNLVQTAPEPQMVKVTNSALHMAVREGNNKSVDTLLLYMSKLHQGSTKMFKDIFDFIKF